MRREGNHFLINDELHDKIAFLLSINKDKRHFVASTNYKYEASFLMEQIACQKKASTKIPEFIARNCFFTQKSIEQATSQKVAEWKCQWIKGLSKEDELISLTAGLGVDDYYFSLQFKHVISIDNDPFLHEIALYNNIQLNATTIHRINMSCTHFLKDNEVINSVIYIDPDRRPNNQVTNKQIDQFSPNVMKIYPELLEQKNQVFIKLSGVTDIDWIKNNFTFIKSICVVSLNQEVREILLQLSKSKSPNLQTTVIIDLSDKTTILREPDINEIAKDICPKENANYVFRPIAGINKTGILQEKKIALSPNTPFYPVLAPINPSLGNSFEILWHKKISLKQLKRELFKQNITGASVVARNTHLNSQECKTFLNLNEDELHFLFVFGNKKENDTYYCKRD